MARRRALFNVKVVNISALCQSLRNAQTERPGARIGAGRPQGAGSEAVDFSEGLGGEFRREIEFPDNRKDVDPGVLAVAEPFDDDALGVGVAIFPFRQAGDDLVTRRSRGGAVPPGLGHVEVVLKTGVVGNDDEEARGFLEGADDFVVAPFENADDPAARAFRFRPAAASLEGSSLDPCDDEISMEGGGGVIGVDAEVGSLALGGRDESESLGVKLDGAGDEIGGSGGDPAVLAHPGNLALLFQLGQGAADGARGGTELAGEGGDVEGGGFFALEKREDPVRQAAGGRHGR